MKLRNIILMTASVAMTACSKQAVPTAIPEDAKIEQQVEELLSKMDLDAKIGQMTELAIDVLGETINGEFQLDEAKLHKAIAEYKVGSFLNAPGPVAQSPEKWNEIIGRIQELSMTEIGMYLRSGSESWYYLYIGRHTLSSKYQYGCCLQSGFDLRSGTCNSL